MTIFPDCGACPGDGSICTTSCKLADESPPLPSTAMTIKANIDAVAAVGGEPKVEKDDGDLTCGLGAVILELRKRKRVTQIELAKAVGLERTSITNIEKGKQKISVHTLAAIADALGVEMHITFKDKS